MIHKCRKCSTSLVAGEICYNIECKFLQEELEGLATFLV